MSDYTPTTRVVRDRYVSAMSRKRQELPMAAKASFDRWLAAHDAAKRAEWEAERPARLTCDGGCSYGDGPQEECSMHGRTPADLWGIIGELIRERDEAQVDEVFIQRYGMYHASFGGVGGDAIRLDITREAWEELGEPRALRASWRPVPVRVSDSPVRDSDTNESEG